MGENDAFVGTQPNVTGAGSSTEPAPVVMTTTAYKMRGKTKFPTFADLGDINTHDLPHVKLTPRQHQLITLCATLPDDMLNARDIAFNMGKDVTPSHMTRTLKQIELQFAKAQSPRKLTNIEIAANIVAAQQKPDTKTRDRSLGSGLDFSELPKGRWTELINHIPPDQLAAADLKRSEWRFITQCVPECGPDMPALDAGKKLGIKPESAETLKAHVKAQLGALLLVAARERYKPPPANAREKALRRFFGKDEEIPAKWLEGNGR